MRMDALVGARLERVENGKAPIAERVFNGGVVRAWRQIHIGTRATRIRFPTYQPGGHCDHSGRITSRHEPNCRPEMLATRESV